MGVEEMSEEKPLNVRCAEALGWTYLGIGECDWEGEPPAGHPLDQYTRRLDQHICIPPYGDDTPGGWACTGPLIGRFRLHLERGTKLPPTGDGARVWFSSSSERGPDGLWVLGPDADTACAAIAGWVAEYGKDYSK